MGGGGGGKARAGGTLGSPHLPRTPASVAGPLLGLPCPVRFPTFNLPVPSLSVPCPSPPHRPPRPNPPGRRCGGQRRTLSGGRGQGHVPDLRAPEKVTCRRALEGRAAHGTPQTVPRGGTALPLVVLSPRSQVSVTEGTPAPSRDGSERVPPPHSHPDCANGS